MAALSQNSALVALGGADAVIEKVQAGEAMVAGNWYYLKTSDNKMWKADADAAASALVRGMVHSPAVAADGYFVGQKGGPAIVGGTLTVGKPYHAHTTGGAMGEISELASGDFPTSLGFARTAAILDIDISVATTALA